MRQRRRTSIGDIGQVIAMTELVEHSGPEEEEVLQAALSAPGIVVSIWADGEWLGGACVPVTAQQALFTVCRPYAGALAELLEEMAAACRQLAAGGEFIPFPTGED